MAEKDAKSVRGKVDLAKVKQRADKDERDKEEAQNRGFKFFKTQKGPNLIRVLPPHLNMDGFPWIERGKHWLGEEGKGRTILCRHKTRDDQRAKPKDCPICAEVWGMYKSDKPKIKELAASMKRKRANIFQVLDMKPLLEFDDPGDVPECFGKYTEDTENAAKQAKKCSRCPWATTCSKGVMVFEVPLNTYDRISKDMRKKDIGDITDYDEGYNVEIEKEVTKPGKDGTKYDTTVSRKPYALDKIIQAYCDAHLLDLNEFYPVPTKEELLAALKGDDDEEEGKKEEQPKKKKPVEDDAADDDDEPPKKKKPVDDDDDEPPKKKKPVDDDDEPPKKKKPADDDDDEPPKKKKPVDDDDDEPPKKKKPADDDDDDDDELARKMREKSAARRKVT